MYKVKIQFACTLGMRNDLSLKSRALTLIARLRQPLPDPAFWWRHRRHERDFTRECVPTFPVLMLLLLQKSLKSLQPHGHEFLDQLAAGPARPKLSGGALTHARAKLRASAFVELNTAAVLARVYGSEHAALVQRWQGHRLLGVDSSLVRLPSRAAVGKVFGWVQGANHHGPLERYPQARVSVLDDLLNQMGLEGRLSASTGAETELAHQQLAKAGWAMVRYADDFVILCRSQAEAQNTLAAVRAWVSEAGLTLHPAKTRVVDASAPGGFDFLGYHFERGMKGPRAKSLKQLKDRVRAKTLRLDGRSLAVIVTEVNRTLRGWYEYFQHSKANVFGPVDGYVRRRLRSLLQKRRGRTSQGLGAAHQRWPNAWFAH